MKPMLRDAIVDMARDQFNAHGYNAVSLRGIADALGISVGNLTYYFKRKEDLVEAVVLRQHEAYERITAVSSMAELNTFFMRILQHHERNAYYFRHYRQLADISPRVFTIQQRVLHDMAEAIEETLNRLRADGQLKAAWTDGQTAHLIHSLQLNLIFGGFLPCDDRLQCVWSLLIPWLTPAGWEAYRALGDATLSRSVFEAGAPVAEQWDLLDAQGCPLGRLHTRGTPSRPGEYHLVVDIWIQDDAGRYLIARRAPEKMPYAGCWAMTFGCAISGDDSLSAALREAREELGLALDPHQGEMRLRWALDAHSAIIDVWFFKQNVALEDIVLQIEETDQAMWATREEILDMVAKGQFIDQIRLPYIEKLI